VAADGTTPAEIAVRVAHFAETERARIRVVNERKANELAALAAEADRLRREREEAHARSPEGIACAQAERMRTEGEARELAEANARRQAEARKREQEAEQRREQARKEEQARRWAEEERKRAEDELRKDAENPGWRDEQERQQQEEDRRDRRRENRLRLAMLGTLGTPAAAVVSAVLRSWWLAAFLLVTSVALWGYGLFVGFDDYLDG
jgi:cation transport ATPase